MSKGKVQKPTEARIPPDQARNQYELSNGEKAMPRPVTEDLLNRIGLHLRTVYDEIVNEPVPDHLVRLLNDLERQQAEKP